MIEENREAEPWWSRLGMARARGAPGRAGERRQTLGIACEIPRLQR